jgi:hypothetical protein
MTRPSGNTPQEAGVPPSRFVSMHEHECPVMGPGFAVVYEEPLSIGESSMVIGLLHGVLPGARFLEVRSKEAVRACLYAGPGLIPLNEPDRVIWIEVPSQLDQRAMLSIIKGVVRPTLPYTGRAIGVAATDGSVKPHLHLRIVDGLSPGERGSLWEALEALDFVIAVGFNADSELFTLRITQEVIIQDLAHPVRILTALGGLGIYLSPSLPRSN